MSLVRIEGFDNQLQTADFISTIGEVNWVLTTVISFFGDHAFDGNSVGIGIGATWANADLTTPLDEWWLGIRIKLAPAGGEAGGYKFIDKATNKEQLTIIFGGDSGSISVSNDTTVLYLSDNNVVPSYAWFYAEIHAKIDSSDGFVEIRINGVTKVLITGVRTQASGANAYWDRVSFGGSGVVTSQSIIIDEMYLCDTSVGPGSNPFNDFQGPIRIFTRHAISNGSTTNFTPLSSTNASQVDEAQMDNDSTYNYDDAGTVGQTDLFNMTALPTSAVPLAVQVKGVYKIVSDTRSMGNVLKSGSTTNVGTAFVLTTSYRHQVALNDVYPEDPDGSIPWSKTSVDATEVGYKITG